MKKACSMFLVILVLLTACSTEMSTPKSYKIVYEVAGTADSADIVIMNESGGSDSFLRMALPFRKTYYDYKDGNMLGVSAQSNSSSGTITCRVLLNGEEVRKSSGSGAYALVTCAGTL